MVKWLLVGLKCEIAKLGGFKGQIGNLYWLEHLFQKLGRSFLEKQGKEEGLHPSASVIKAKPREVVWSSNQPRIKF